MVNAPTVPAAYHRSARHQPEGHHRVPRKDTLRPKLKAAAETLRKHNAPDLADAVESVIVPNGWAELRDTEVAGSGTNLSLSLEESIRDEIRRKAALAERALSYDVNEGFLALLNGTYTPRVTRRRRSRQPVTRVALNVTPNAELHWRVLSETDYKPRQVAADYLMLKYEVGPYEPGAEPDPLPNGTRRQPLVPGVLRSQIMESLEAAGDHSVNEVITEGLRLYVDGEFTPGPLSWPGYSQADLKPLVMRPNDDLYKAAQEKLDQERATTPGAKASSPTSATTAGGLKSAAQVGIAYLIHKYQIELPPAE